ncbi:MAG TPA: glycoside hydrolase family 6 protein [Solirubrobacteraceae bacterium]|jgi:endoglucanase|nr:glycoside hydrolase family 6 protein [Solirubrobacteraceae bacterium]
MRRRTALALLLATAIAIAIGACASTVAPEATSAGSAGSVGGAESVRSAQGSPGSARGRARGTSVGDPLAGQTLYVNPNNAAARVARELQARGDARDGELLAQRIASEPTATWFTSVAAPVESQVSSLVGAATAASRLAVLVAYAIPHRDCASGYSAGGAGTAAQYMAWIAQLAAGIGRRRAVVILEPDAVPEVLSGCLSVSDALARLALLRGAIETLERDSAASVYIDAGNPGWIKPPSRLAGPLRAAGIARAAGFALNVANFHSDAASIAYGTQLSRLLGGAHFVIDTSRNGNGPDTNPADSVPWCNPPGRALGRAPSTQTGERLLDAYLWVKQPGESDGSCRPGAPPAGQFWLSYALELAGG